MLAQRARQRAIVKAQMLIDNHIGHCLAEVCQVRQFMFAMGRLDVFSMGDVGLRNGVNRLFGEGVKLDEDATLEIVQRWSPYRSVASWYLWRHTENAPQT